MKRFARHLPLAALALTGAVQAGALAQDIQPPEARTAIGRATEPPAPNATAVASLEASRSRRHGLAQDIASSARVGLLEAGADTARQAVLDCQRDALQGSGTGTLGMPFGRPGSRTDHCFR